MPPSITKDTLIPLSSLLAVLGIAITSAFSYGQISNKVDNTNARVSELTAYTQDGFKQVNDRLDTLIFKSISYGETTTPNN